MTANPAGPTSVGPTTPGGSGRRAGGATQPRLTHFKWSEVAIGPLRTITPAPGETLVPVTMEQHIKRALKATTNFGKKDTRPTLLYFHWPHEDAKNGKLTTTLCTRTMDDEVAARWGKLFRLVQIDMERTDADIAKRIGNTGKPGFVALSDTLKVVARIPAVKSSSKLRKALESAFNKFPKHRKALKQRLKLHERWLDEAKRLEKQDKFDEAVALVDKVRFGDVRVGPNYDKAVSYGMLLAQKAEAAAAANK